MFTAPVVTEFKKLKAERHDDGAGYSEMEKHPHTCTECDKLFYFETEISFQYTPEKAV